MKVFSRTREKALHFLITCQLGALAQSFNTMNETERYSKPDFEFQELVIEDAILQLGSPGKTEGGEEGEEIGG